MFFSKQYLTSCGPGRASRQCKIEERAAVFERFMTTFAALQFRQAADNGKTQAGEVFGFMQGIKRLKEVFPAVFRNSGAIVSNPEADGLLVLLPAEFDL